MAQTYSDATDEIDTDCEYMIDNHGEKTKKDRYKRHDKMHSERPKKHLKQQKELKTTKIEQQAANNFNPSGKSIEDLKPTEQRFKLSKTLKETRVCTKKPLYQTFYQIEDSGDLFELRNANQIATYNTNNNNASGYKRNKIHTIPKKNQQSIIAIACNIL